MSDESAASAQHRVDVLRRAYRVLKADFEQREQALSLERAAHATTLAESQALATRVEAAERELSALKEDLRMHATAADAVLRRHAAAPAANAPAAAATLPPAGGVPAGGAASTAIPQEVRGTGTGSYQRGMDWADRVLSNVNIFSAALCGSTALAEPPPPPAASHCAVCASPASPPTRAAATARSQVHVTRVHFHSATCASGAARPAGGDCRGARRHRRA